MNDMIRPYTFSVPILRLGYPTADGRLITDWPRAWPPGILDLASDVSHTSGQVRTRVLLPNPHPDGQAEKIGDVTHLALVRRTVHAFGAVYLDRLNLERIHGGLCLPEPDLFRVISQPALREFSFGARLEITDWRLGALHLGTKPVWDLPPVSLWEA